MEGAKTNKTKTRITLMLQLCLLLVFALAAVLFACEGKVSVTLSLEGELFPGQAVSPTLEFSGDERKVKDYSEKDFRLIVLSGEEFVSVREGKVVISESAAPEAEFTLRAEVGSLVSESTFRVAAPPIESVSIVAPEFAAAGDRVLLGAEISPRAAASLPVSFELVSGDGIIEGGYLIIPSYADKADSFVIRASVCGVKSENVTVSVTTVQPKAIEFVFEESTCMPGASISVSASVSPENASFPLEVSLVGGADAATYDADTGTLSVMPSAEMKREITLRAICGGVTKEAVFTVDLPAIKTILPRRERLGVRPGEEVTFSFSVMPEGADPRGVKVALVEGADSVEWTGGSEFTVYGSAEDGAEIVFYFSSDSGASATLNYKVERKSVDSVYLSYSGNASYAKCGEKIYLSAEVSPADADGSISYIITEGEELVTLAGDELTVKDGVGRGFVSVIAEASCGTFSNEIRFSVSGRYSRRVYSSWQNVYLSSENENECIWMVLPEAKKAGGVTVVVPAEVKDLVIEGHYTGEESALTEDLYFYFRNAPSRRVTLVNFGTKATFGFGGTVMDFGSGGEAEIILEGKNHVEADSPFFLNNEGEITNGVWNNDYPYPSQVALKRSGVSGKNGTAGGTAIAGYALSFSGSGSLTAVAGSGADGGAGGSGADAEFDEEELFYLSGAGGNGGAGGDSGAAIRAYEVIIDCALSVAAGNAGVGGKGGSAGSVAALGGKSVTAAEGETGRDGPSGKPISAIDASKVTGKSSGALVGRVVSRTEKNAASLSVLADKLARFYGISLYYGTSLYNPYKNLPSSRRYVMDAQTDETEIMRQASFLSYTMGQMPKNCWREISFLSGKAVTVYFAKTITSGSGSNILGLTSDANRVWFATFNTEIRGVFYSGYFNIMLHEFVHVLHYNLSSEARTAFEKELKSYNFGLGYKSSYGATERVYGVTEGNDAANSCFLSSYSRKTVMEDAAETASLIATLTFAESFLAAGTHIRQKYDLIARTFAGDYETLSFTHVPNLFGYRYLLS